MTDPRPALGLLAGRDVSIDEDDVNAAVRRAVLLLATGGDPRGGLDLDSRGVRALADDLHSPAHVEELADGLAALDEAALGLLAVQRALASLRADPDLAWRSFVCGLLVAELT